MDFDTTRPVYATRADKCHISHVVADTDSWEQKLAAGAGGHARGRPLRQEPQPRLHHPLHARTARSSNYIPDFIACIDDGHGPDDLLNLIVEVTGEKKKDKAAKVATARTLWVPAVNNHGGFGRWAFIEIADPWDAENIDQIGHWHADASEFATSSAGRRDFELASRGLIGRTTPARRRRCRRSPCGTSAATLEREREQVSPEKRRASRQPRDLIDPVPDANLLWRDLHVRSIASEEPRRRPRTSASTSSWTA